MTKKNRKFPHWFASKKEAYENFTVTTWVIHPDTYSHKFVVEMERISKEKSKLLKGEKLDYSTHDLRRTFITNAFKKNKVPDEIRLAAGHSDIRNTMKYAKDHRELDGDATYTPESEDAA